nr:TIGR03960 family B12-binding radical SAM protein [candidate division Zixibacteria bacterium]
MEKKFFPFVMKPGRYTGGEPGQFVKSHENHFRLALGYPDKYDIGMSYLGLQNLYSIVNADERFLCERFFAPDIDAEAVMRRENIPCFTLESFTPLKEFDLVGFTLAYEMTFTNVLNILDLSGIPLRAVDRTDHDPLVIAGGPVVHNPEPTAAFFDMFHIGDADENILRLLEVLNDSESLNRIEKLERVVREVSSIYVPHFYDAETRRPLFDFVPSKIKSCRIKKLEGIQYTARPIVPFIEIVHDRLTVEIMRGCPRGCRFCQASAIYKPVRPREKEDIIRQVKNQIEQTGHDEVSLLSLSSSDYPDIIPLTIQLSRMLEELKIALSLPSLRPGTFTQQLAEAVKTTRKTGLTFAPEAGTERLRAVIRKDITDKDLMDTISLVFKNGWKLVKLYFMIGLPTETDEDVEGIVHLIRQAVTIAKNGTGKYTINVTISPFSPKSHTPFQWDEQATPEEIRRKNDYIKRNVRSSLVNIKLRDPELPFIEGIMGRGGRELAEVIETAFKTGARFDGWSENFKFKLWMEAFRKHGLDPYDYMKGRSFSSELPWSHIEMQQSVEYLIKERNRTSTLLKEQKKHVPPLISPDSDPDEDDGFGRGRKKLTPRSTSIPTKSKVRVRWGKRGLTRFLSHLDNVRVFERAIRRSRMPVEYSLGFHPHMKLSFGPPLQLGYMSEAEYFDIQLERPFLPSMADRLDECLPDGYYIIKAMSIIDSKQSLSARLNRAVYEVIVEGDGSIPEKINNLMNRETVEINRETKTEIKTVDIRSAVFKIDYLQKGTIDPGSAGIILELGVGTAGYARPSEVIAAAGLVNASAIPALKIVRKDLLYLDDQGNRLTPMEF